ncbi:hypothetical protein [Thiorhodospira sibirica]|uniref:hypothetical protein n=1 Tax=Thiorhodospira sibirica TaxID=154347 RepID=UPI0005924B31|nr:hypothetical protein [Thiorhodospira sibirica]
MLFAVAVGVLNVIALGFEGIVVFVLYFPSGTTRSAYIMGCGKTLFLQHSLVFEGADELAPINQQGIGCCVQRQRLGEAFGVAFACPPPHFRV